MLLCFLFILLGCKSEKTHQINLEEIPYKEIENEVGGLTSNDQKKAFLQQINDLDQEVRIRSNEVVKNHGYDSEDNFKVTEEMINIDRINLAKIEAYLKLYGYPKIDSVGGEAASTAWLVIHHASSIEVREKHFDTFYKAYKSGDLEGGQFTFYLNRFYEMKKGERMDIVGAFTEEFEIDTLLRSMDLLKEAP